MTDSRVNLFVIGQPKTGTTSLHKYFQRHPDIWTPNQKQLYHFAEDHNSHRQTLQEFRKPYYQRYYNYDIEDYQRHFVGGESKSYRVDVTPDYVYSESAADSIYCYNPEAKILLILREPIGFLRSFHAQLVSSANELESNFERALTLEESRRNSSVQQAPSCPPALLAYSKLIDYSHLIRRFHNRFNGKMKVMIYEEFQKDNAKQLTLLYNWLGLEPIEMDVVIHANSGTLRNPRLQRLLKWYPVRLISDMVPWALKEHLKRRKKSKKEGKSKPIISPELSAILPNIPEISRYMDENLLRLDSGGLSLNELWTPDA